MTRHKQVAHTTLDGQVVEVDAGMKRVLELFAALGVRTCYSCEGGNEDQENAYVLGNGKDLWRLERFAKKYVNTGRSSLHAIDMNAFMFRNRHAIEISHFRDEGSDLRWQWHRGHTRYNAGLNDHVVKLYSNHYGFRINWSWPSDGTQEMEEWLSELVHARA